MGDNGVYDDASDFDHINNSPDIRLRSIEIDNELTGRKLKSNAAAVVDSDGKSEADDNSGTGHRVNSNKKDLATVELTKVRNEKDKAIQLVKRMKDSFLKFKLQNQ